MVPLLWIQPTVGHMLAKLRQSCPTLCNPIDGSLPGSPAPGIFQARTLEQVAISFSNAWKWKMKVKSLSRVWLLATPWTAAYQAPPSMRFSKQEYWSGVPLPSPNVHYVLEYQRAYNGNSYRIMLIIFLNYWLVTFLYFLIRQYAIIISKN